MTPNTYKLWLIAINALICAGAMNAGIMVPTNTINTMLPNDNSKDWNFAVYMSNNNNLHRFGLLNFREMVQSGSTAHMNLLLQMDEFGEREISRFYINQSNPVIVESHSNTLTSFSGTPGNLYEFIRWQITNFPAKNLCSVLWNHGAGIKDPGIWGRMLMRWRDDLFKFNKKTGILELDRSLAKNDEAQAAKNNDLAHEKDVERGIAFNEATCTYLTNQDLKISLDRACKDFLPAPQGTSKLTILAMDACHMAMIEIATQIKSAVEIMVASEEVEPGRGYNYLNALKPFSGANLSPYDLATHLVAAYDFEYRSTTGDYTQSAADLSYCDAMEANISALSNALIALIENNPSVGLKSLREIRLSSQLTTEFFDNDYIDLGHFYKSLIIKAASIKEAKWGLSLTQKQTFEQQWKDVGKIASDGLAVLRTMVFANAVGRNLSEAEGLAIYFPLSYVHHSYYKTEFARLTTWPQFLEKYLKAKRPKHYADQHADPVVRSIKSGAKKLALRKQKHA